MSKEESVFYICPNKCEDTWFYQNGVTQTVRQLTEIGEEMGDDHYDFTPDGPVKCRKCDAEAKIGKKVVTTTIEVAEET